AFPMIGLTATTLAAVSRKASRIRGTARIGPILVMGLLGAIRTASDLVIASSRPGAGLDSEAPAKRTDFTGSWYRRFTKYSSKLSSPAGVSMRVFTRWSLIGRTRERTPNFSAMILAVSVRVRPRE